MARIVASKAPFQRTVMSIEDARAFFAERGEVYKVDQVEELARQGETQVSLYRQRDFVDLCRGPHLSDTGRIGSVKLLSVAGAYWRGSEKNPQLTRIYATAFPTSEGAGGAPRAAGAGAGPRPPPGGARPRALPLRRRRAGLPVLPAQRDGDRQRDQGGRARGAAAHGLRRDPDARRSSSDELWRRSGHYDHYREHMYFTDIDGQGFAVKPMNCPGACLVYRSRRHSYRELPLRYAEFGHVHRHELSGVLHGLFRVRAFTQDDAHIFCRLDQVQEEVRAVLDLTDRFYARFGFEHVVTKLATRPEKASRQPGDVGRRRGGPARRPWATAPTS